MVCVVVYGLACFCHTPQYDASFLGSHSTKSLKSLPFPEGLVPFFFRFFMEPTRQAGMKKEGRMGFGRPGPFYIAMTTLHGIGNPLHDLRYIAYWGLTCRLSLC